MSRRTLAAATNEATVTIAACIRIAFREELWVRRFDIKHHVQHTMSNMFG